MNVKRLVLSAAAVLLLTAFAPAAQAVVAPIPNVSYVCLYFHPGGSFDNGLSGTSIFTWNYMNTPTQKRGIETYSLNNGTHDNEKIVFVWKSNPTAYSSQWEFTKPLAGLQCKDTVVASGGNTIAFADCTDGHTAVCFR